jgi:hypothetical protein
MPNDRQDLTDEERIAILAENKAKTEKMVKGREAQTMTINGRNVETATPLDKDDDFALPSKTQNNFIECVGCQ